MALGSADMIKLHMQVASFNKNLIIAQLVGTYFLSFWTGKSVALPIFLHGILISIFQVSPAMAKPISRALSGSDKLKVGTIRSAELQSMPKWIRKLFRIWRKLFAGSFGRIDKFGNKANNIPWKSVARVAVIIIAALTLSTVMLKWEDFSQTSRLKNEIKREVQYREVCTDSVFFSFCYDL